MGQAADWGRQELGRSPWPEPPSINAPDAPSVDLSFTDQVAQRPLTYLGIAVASGFAIGWITGGRSDDDSSAEAPRYSTPPAPQSWATSTPDDGPGVIQTIQSGLGDSIRRGTGHEPGDLLGSLTAALTGLFVDAAKDLLDQNLPGFKERYEHAARMSGGIQPGEPGPMQTDSSTIRGDVQTAAPAASI
jgi:hypothetical protein